MGLFGKSPDPKEQVNDWCKKLRKESNQIDRQINGIRREEAKVTKSLKDAAKKGDKDVCKILGSVNLGQCNFLLPDLVLQPK